jgi:hypothetical protein
VVNPFFLRDKRLKVVGVVWLSTTPLTLPESDLPIPSINTASRYSKQGSSFLQPPALSCLSAVPYFNSYYSTLSFLY